MRSSVWFFGVRCFVVLTMSSLQLIAQQSDPNVPTYKPSSAFFSFNGRMQIFGEYSNQRGSFMDKDPRYAYAEFAPSFAIFGVPLSASILYSTEDRALRQRINTANLSINPAILQSYIVNRAQEQAEAYANEHLTTADQARDSIEKYRDVLEREAPERLKELEQSVRMDEIRRMNPRDLASNKSLLKEAGLLSSYENVMMWLPRVGIGTNYPMYTDLSLSGIAVRGVDVEWNPGKFYLAFCTGSVLNPIPQYHPFDPFRSIDSTQSTAPIYARELSAFRIGYGSKSSNYFILSFLKAKDDPSSLNIPVNDSVSSPSSPQESIVADVEWLSTFFDGRLSLGAECAVSLFSSDVTSSEVNIDLDTNNAIVAFLKRQIQIRISSFWDWATSANAKISIPETGTRLSAVVRRVGAGYRSLGLLNQRSDYIRLDLRADQSFFQRQLSIGGFYRDDHDNLLDWKRATTSIVAYGVTLGLNPRNLPFLRLTYSPYVQKNNALGDSIGQQNTTTMLSTTLGYGYRLIGASHSTTISYVNNSIESYLALSDFAIESYSFGHTTNLSFPLSLSLAISHVQQKNTSTQLDLPALLSVWELQLSANYTLNDVWNFGAGLNIADEQADGTRTGFFASLNVPVYSIAVFDLRAEKNVFKSSTLSGTQQYLRPYDETIVRASLSKYW